MPPADSTVQAFSADGHVVQWDTWDDSYRETLSLAWDNEAWTATGQVGRENVQYVLRISPTWHVRQFLLFRDLDEPDLWLAVDAAHRWGEINGTYRPEFGRRADIQLSCTPFTATMPIRRLGLALGATADVPVISVDVDTLAATPDVLRYERTAVRAWRSTSLTTDDVRTFVVDEYGLVIAEPGRFKRSP